MVHASSVDHVPIHAYGVNLSLHFVSTVSTVSTVSLFQPSLTAKYSMPRQRRVRVSHPIRKPTSRAFWGAPRILPVLVCAIAKPGQSLSYFCLHCFVCFACFDCFKRGLAGACPEHPQRTRKRRGRTLGPAPYLLRFGAVKTQPHSRVQCYCTSKNLLFYFAC